jgi:GT2 family glycosyltransferase
MKEESFSFEANIFGENVFEELFDIDREIVPWEKIKLSSQKILQTKQKIAEIESLISECELKKYKVEKEINNNTVKDPKENELKEKSLKLKLKEIEIKIEISKKEIEDRKNLLLALEEKYNSIKKIIESSHRTQNQEEKDAYLLKIKNQIESNVLKKEIPLDEQELRKLMLLPESDFDHILHFARQLKYTYDSGKFTHGLLSRKNNIEYLKSHYQSKEIQKIAELDNAQRANFRIGVVQLFRNEEEEKAGGISDPQNSLLLPRDCQLVFFTVHSLPVDEARNQAAQKALENNCDYLLFIDDDLIIPRNALQVLFEEARRENYKIIGGEYCYKMNPYKSACLTSVHIGGGKFKPANPVFKGELIPELKSQGEVIDCNIVLATGCMLIDMSVFKEMSHPWFDFQYIYDVENQTKRTCISEDSSFTRKCIDMGITPKLHTGVRCLHVDMRRRIVYGERNPEELYCANHKHMPYRIYSDSDSHIPKIHIGITAPVKNYMPLVNVKDLRSTDDYDTSTYVYHLNDSKLSEMYSHITKEAIENGSDYLIILDSDIIPTKDIVRKLFNRLHLNNCSSVSGIYPNINNPEFSDAYVLNEEQKMKNLIDPYNKRGLIDCNFAVPIKCIAFNLAIFSSMPSPWFYEVEASKDNPKLIKGADGIPKRIHRKLTVGESISERMAMMGAKSEVDTDIQCLYLNREKLTAIGSEKIIKDGKIKNEEISNFSILDSFVPEIKE